MGPREDERHGPIASEVLGRIGDWLERAAKTGAAMVSVVQMAYPFGLPSRFPLERLRSPLHTRRQSGWPWRHLMRNAPASIVTLLFTDIEGSTKSWEAHPEPIRSPGATTVNRNRIRP